MAEGRKKEEEDKNEPSFESEDPVSFLKRMRDNSPNTLSMLNAKQARLLSKSSTAPYEKEDVNEEYLTDMAASVGTKHMVETANRQLREGLLTPHNKTEELDVESFEKQTKTLEKVGKGAYCNGAWAVETTVMPVDNVHACIYMYHACSRRARLQSMYCHAQSHSHFTFTSIL